jgi:hypothetical protein
MTNQMALYIPSELISSRKRNTSGSKVSVSFPVSSHILERIADSDETAINDCLTAYGSLVWALTKKYTSNEDEAEIAVQEIFLDIWKYAERFDSAKTDEATFISHIACRKLMKRNHANGDCEN